jgi:xanthine/uracil permease
MTPIKTIGDIEATTGTVDRRPSNDEMEGGLVADGVMSMFAGLLGAFPNTSFSQNVGLIGFTGVASRFVVAIAGAFLVVLGFLPKVAAIVGAMPNPVLGGAAIVLFGMIFAIGLRIFADRVAPSQRNLTIVAVSVLLGVGVEVRPDAIAAFPDEVQVLLGSGLLVGGLTAVILNAVLPGDGGTPESAPAPDGVATGSE